MLTLQRYQRYRPDLGELTSDNGFILVTPAESRRIRHKDRCRKAHGHYPDPDRPGKILRCLRCRPLPRQAA
jgi:hypothetical protein